MSIEFILNVLLLQISLRCCFHLDSDFPSAVLALYKYLERRTDGNDKAAAKLLERT
jgi:hypothetical protein